MMRVRNQMKSEKEKEQFRFEEVKGTTNDIIYVHINPDTLVSLKHRELCGMVKTSSNMTFSFVTSFLLTFYCTLTHGYTLFCLDRYLTLQTLRIYHNVKKITKVSLPHDNSSWKNKIQTKNNTVADSMMSLHAAFKESSITSTATGTASKRPN